MMLLTTAPKASSPRPFTLRLLVVAEPDYDLIVLDLVLPGGDGFAVLRALRGRGVATPVLVLTARDAVADRVAGLDLGADDYLTKPFAFEEFLARVRALLRRGPGPAAPVLRVGDLALNRATREVTRAGRSIALTAREYALLEYLMSHAGRVLTREAPFGDSPSVASGHRTAPSAYPRGRQTGGGRHEAVDWADGIVGERGCARPDSAHRRVQ